MRDVRSLFVVAAFTMTIAGWGCATSEDTAKGGTGGHEGGTGGAVGSGGMVGSGGSGSGGMVGSGGSGSGGATVTDAGSDTGGAPDAGGVVATGPATFTELWTTIFSLSATDSPYSCAGAACHNPKTNGQVNLSTKMMAYTSLRAKVMPNKPDGSALVTRLENMDPAKRMPLAKPMLPDPMKQRVRSWIMNGAKND